MIPRANRTTGFSLVELLIGLAIFGVLLSLALPSFSEWMGNIRVRNQADVIQGGLQQARAEALRRNRFVRFQLVSVSSLDNTSLDNTCLVTDNSNRWIVSHGDPSAACDQAQSQALPADNNLYSATPVLLIRGVQESRQDEVQTVMVLTRLDGSVIAAPPAPPAPAGTSGHPLCFSPSGQLTRYDTTSLQCTASMNPGTTMFARATINVTSTASACAPAGTVRCLRVTVGSSGETRLCDPALPQLASRTVGAATVNLRDVRGCFCDPLLTNSALPDYCID